MLTKDLDRICRSEGQIVFPWPQSFRRRLLLRVEVVLKKSYYWWTVGFIYLGNTHHVVTTEELEICGLRPTRGCASNTGRSLKKL